MNRKTTIERMKEAAGEQWHVRGWSTNYGRKSGYFVMRDSERNISGTPLASFKKYEEAKAVCDSHNNAI